MPETDNTYIDLQIEWFLRAYPQLVEMLGEDEARYAAMQMVRNALEAFIAKQNSFGPIIGKAS